MEASVDTAALNTPLREELRIAPSEPISSASLKSPEASAYYPLISRKLMEGICGVSTNTLVKYANEGIIHPRKAKHGGLEFVAYHVEDIQAVFKKKGISYKRKETAEVIAVFSQKGGTGKSSFTQQIASMLSLVGKVLVVDLDSQGDLTLLLNVGTKPSELVTDSRDLDPTIAELMDWTLIDGSYHDYERCSLDQVIKTVSPTLHVIPADLNLGEINYSLNRSNLKRRYNEDGTEKSGSPELYMVQEVVDKVKHLYDFVIFDCAPNIETLNVSALYAANRILMPLELEAKALLVARRNEEFLKRLLEFDIGFKWDKVLIVPNKYATRHSIKMQAYSALQQIYSDPNDLFQLSEVLVPSSTIIDRCAQNREPVFVAATRYAKDSRSNVAAAKEFTNYFWYIMHELIEQPLDHIVFDSAPVSEA